MRKSKKVKKKQKETKNKHPWIYLFLLVFIVIITFAKSTNFDFVHIDDKRLIYENPLVTDESVPYSECFSKFIYSAHYKPFVFLTWKAEYQLFGDSPSHFHLINWLLHLANSILLFIIGLQLFRRIYSKNNLVLFSSFALALLFALHPLKIESVVWATERKDVLFSFFFLLSWLMYIFYLKKKQYFFIILGSVLYLMSGLSKSMGITLFAILFLTDFWYRKEFNFKSVFEKIPYLFVFLFLLFLYGMLDFGSSDKITNGSVEQALVVTNQISSLEFINTLPTVIQWIVTTSARFVLWFAHCLIPVKLSVIYPHNKIFSFLGYSMFLFPFVIAGFYFFLWKRRKKDLELLLAFLFFGISLSPALALKYSGQLIFLSDRYTYIPSIGLLLVIIILINKLNWKKARYYASFALIFLFYFIITFTSINHWENAESLFKQALKIFPESGLAHLNLGLYYNEQNNNKKALEVYSKGINLSPRFSLLYTNRGKIYLDSGNLDLALADFNKSLSIWPNSFKSLTNRGAVFEKKNDLMSALSDLNRALELKPNDITSLQNRGIVYYRLKEYEKTIEDYRKYLQFKPNDPVIINSIGLSYRKINQNNEAIAEYNRAIAINPTNSAYFMNRSYAFNAIGDKKSALRDAQKAKQLGFKVNTNYLKPVGVSKE